MSRMNNDRLKFRVWDKRLKRYDNSIARYIDDEGNLCIAGYDCMHYCVEDFIAERCTGLRDKRGRLIFEGDVCLFSSWKNPKAIEWRDGRFWLVDSFVVCCEMECSLMEIIGNIHEQGGQR